MVVSYYQKVYLVLHTNYCQFNCGFTVSDVRPKICTDSDDYGFLSRPLNKNKEPRVIIAPRSPRNEVTNAILFCSHYK